MSAAAYFDVDGTLVGTNLLHPTLSYLATQPTPVHSAVRLATLVLDTPFLLRAELQDRRLFNERLFAHFRGMTQDRLEVISEEVFEDHLVPRIFRGTQALVDKCHDAGMRVVLVTGSLDVTIKPLVKHLGADGYIANRLEMKDRIATGKLVQPVVAGPAKARILVADARAHGHDLADCHAYSDSFSDVPMLSVVGHPFCVNPDVRLARIASAYRWPVLQIDQPQPGEGGAPATRRLFGFFA